MPISLVTRPSFWLLAQAAVLLGFCLTTDAFELLPIDDDGYWSSLREMERGGLAGILSNVRTFGYPLLLLLVEQISPSLQALPLVQVAVRVLAVFVFYAGLRSVSGGKGWLAMLVASTLLYANAIFSGDVVPRVSQVMSDAVGESLLILTAGLLLRIAGRPARPLPWVAFTLSLFLTYQTRPAYQFLIALFPVLGWVLLGLAVPRPEWVRWRLRVGLGLLAACLVPFLGWCTFRLLTVGHFGVVSYTGNALCGIAGQFLTEELVAELPAHLRPFARAVLRRRAKFIAGELTTQFGTWKRAFDENGRLVPGIVDDDDIYVLTQIDLFDHTAGEFCDYDLIRKDRLLTEVAVALIKARPGQYLQWIAEAVRLAPDKVLRYNRVLLALVVVLAALVAAWHALYIFRRLQYGPGALARRPRPEGACLPELHLMLALALGVAICQVVLVAGTVGFQERYYDSAGVFLPGVVVVVLVCFWPHVQALLSPPTEGAARTAGPEFPAVKSADNSQALTEQ